MHGDVISSETITWFEVVYHEVYKEVTPSLYFFDLREVLDEDNSHPLVTDRDVGSWEWYKHEEYIMVGNHFTLSCLLVMLLH